MKAMIGSKRESTARCYTCAIEGVIWIIHLITAKNRFQATLIKGLVVGHQRQTFYKRFYLSPYFGEYRSLVGVGLCQSVYPCIPIKIIIRFWMDERIVRIHHLTTTHHNNTYAAHAGSLIVSGLEIYRCKIIHAAKIMIFQDYETKRDDYFCHSSASLYLCRK